MRRIFLIGYMGAGKSTIGLVLAKRLGLSFIDLDHFIEKRYNKTVSQIFSEKGEERFREIESKILKEVAEFEDVVISTGGGAPCFHGNMDRMNDTGICVYLKTSPGELARRLEVCKNTRPLIKDKTKEELVCFIEENLAKREPFYSRAQIIFDAEKMLTDTDVQHITDQIIEMLNNTKDNGNF